LPNTRRREILKVLLGAAALPLLPREALAALGAVHAQASNETSLKTLNPHQNAIVETIAEIILPETQTPGAKSAGVAGFIDVILTDWADATERQTFLEGLAAVDRRSQALFAGEFSALTPPQQLEIVRLLDEEFAAEGPAPSELGESYHQPHFSRTSFFAMMKRLTLTGYYTSSVGARRELHYHIVPTSILQCAPVTPRGAN